MTPEMLDLVLAPRSGLCCQHIKCGGGHMCFRSLGEKRKSGHNAGFAEGFVTCVKCRAVLHGWFMVKDGQLFGKV